MFTHLLSFIHLLSKYLLQVIGVLFYTGLSGKCSLVWKHLIRNLNEVGEQAMTIPGMGGLSGRGKNVQKGFEVGGS